MVESKPALLRRNWDICQDCPRNWYFQSWETDNCDLNYCPHSKEWHTYGSWAKLTVPTDCPRLMEHIVLNQSSPEVNKETD